MANFDTLVKYSGGTNRNQILPLTLASIVETPFAQATDTNTVTPLFVFTVPQGGNNGSSAPLDFNTNPAVTGSSYGRKARFINGVEAPWQSPNTFDNGRAFVIRAMGTATLNAGSGNTVGINLYQGTNAPADFIPITNPTPTASTTLAGSTATFTLASAAHQIDGTSITQVGIGGSPVTVALGAVGLSLTAAAAVLNANSGFTTASLVASVSGASLIITGPVDTPSSSPISNPTPTGSTTSVGSTATFVLADVSHQIDGTLEVKVGTGGSLVTVALGATGLSLTAAAGILNADSGFIAASLVASVSGADLIITGPMDVSVDGANTLIITGTTLNDVTPAVNGTNTLIITGTALNDVTPSAGTTTQISGLTPAGAPSTSVNWILETHIQWSTLTGNLEGWFIGQVGNTLTAPTALTNEAAVTTSAGLTFVLSSIFGSAGGGVVTVSEFVLDQV